MDSNIKYKLSAYEATPPKEAWENIAALLDTDEEYRIAQKLNNVTENPPAYLWDSIEAELDETNHHPATNRPLIVFRRFKQPAMYIGAAALLLLVLSTTYFFNINNTGSGKEANAPVIKTNTVQNFSVAIPVINDKAAVSDKSEPSASSAASATHKQRTSQNKAEQNAVSNRTKKVVSNRNKDYVAALVSDRPSVSEPSILERYIIVPKPSGEAVKLSKKLYTFFSCYNKNREDCKDSMEQLQQKAATPSLATSGDFTGILELVKNLQDN